MKTQPRQHISNKYNTCTVVTSPVYIGSKMSFNPDKCEVIRAVCLMAFNPDKCEVIRAVSLVSFNPDKCEVIRAVSLV